MDKDSLALAHTKGMHHFGKKELQLVCGPLSSGNYLSPKQASLILNTLADLSLNRHFNFHSNMEIRLAPQVSLDVSPAIIDGKKGFSFSIIEEY
jgi:hypothetical protein